MNGNYEWNKQLSRQRTQQRYREAELHRQARQQQPVKQAPETGDLGVMLGRIILLVHKARARVIMIQPLRRTWLG
jgi:hypothetical protein